jgi:hypothetical protein
MKTAEEILENIMCCTIEEGADLDVKSNYYYQHDDVVKAIEQAQKETYNQALEDAAEAASCEYEKDYLTGEIDKESILKLKK